MLKFFIPVLLFSLHTENFPAVTEKEAEIYVKEAYRAGYPLMAMELIRKSMTQGELKKASMGQFTHEKSLPSPDHAPNRWMNMDFLYSAAWVDLSKEPYLLSIPKLDGRRAEFPLVNAWNELVLALKKEGNFAIVGPNWEGSLPIGWKVINMPTNNVFIPGSIGTSGTPEDLQKVHAIQEGLDLRPLSFEKGDDHYSLEDLSKREGKDINHSLNREAYFAELANNITGNERSKNKSFILKKLGRVGIKPGIAFHTASLDSKIQEAMKSVPKKMPQKLLFAKKEIENRGSWSYSLQEGFLGADYIQRTSSRFHDFPQESMYLYTNRDEINNKLDGKERYILHISKEKLPKVKNTWSLTAYDAEGNLVQNPIGRYTLNREGVDYNADGSLDIYIQNRYPGPRKENNWLPVPEKSFALILRLYEPENEVLEKNWRMPGLKKEDF